MSYDLDFSRLSDEQLIHLIRAACTAAMQRGATCEAQVLAIYLNEQERAQAAQAGAADEAERQRQEEVRRVERDAAEQVRAAAQRAREDEAALQEARLWGLKKGSAVAVKVLFGACGFSMQNMSVAVWKKGTERRVYIGYGVDSGIVTYYLTGNRYHPPGSLENTRKDKDIKARSQEVKALCVALAATWNEVRIDVLAALGWTGEAIPLKDYVPPLLPAPPVVPVPVTLPPTLAHRDVGGIRCIECNQWARVGESIRHTRHCETQAQVPAGYVHPVEAHAPAQLAAAS